MPGNDTTMTQDDTTKSRCVMGQVPADPSLARRMTQMTQRPEEFAYARARARTRMQKSPEERHDVSCVMPPGDAATGGDGSSGANGVPYARGNSRGIRLSLLRLSERRTGRPAWAATLAHVAECGGPAGNGATPNDNATRGNDAAASGRG